MDSASVASDFENEQDPTLFEKEAGQGFGVLYDPLFTPQKQDLNYGPIPATPSPVPAKRHLQTSCPRPTEEPGSRSIVPEPSTDGHVALLVADDSEEEIVRGFVSKVWREHTAERWAREQRFRAWLERKNGVRYSLGNIHLPQVRRRSPERASGMVLAPPVKRLRLDRPTLTLQSIRDNAARKPHSSPAKPANGSRSSPAPSALVQRAQDTDWESIPDYTPPFVNIPPNSPNALKILGKTSSVLDARKLPNSDKLHPSEITAATTLRLTPDQYLTVKRRIFQARFEALRDGKSWNKTAAQMKCKIDVNKTSSLWSAYERVGWFDEKLMEPHLRKGRGG